MLRLIIPKISIFFQSYFQKEINEVLQRFNSNDEIDGCGGLKCLKRNSKSKPKAEIDRDNPKYIETNEWANNVLKELDNINLYDEKSSIASGVSINEDETNICNIPKPKKHVRSHNIEVILKLGLILFYVQCLYYETHLLFSNSNSFHIHFC